MSGVMRVLWNCDMGEACSNTERPGVHDEYDDMRRCRGEFVDADKSNVRSFE